VLKKKLTNVGFDAPSIAERRPFGLTALTRYSLFPPEFLDFVRAVVLPDRHDTIVFLSSSPPRNRAEAGRAACRSTARSSAMPVGRRTPTASRPRA
jgi:hypothetical protein